MDHSQMNHDDSADDTVEYIKFAGIIAVIVLVSYGLFVTYGDDSLRDFLRLFMGVFLVVFSLFKFIGYKMFVMMFPGYDLIASKAQLYARAFPFIELGLGIAYLANQSADVRHIVTIVLMGVGSLGILRQIQQKKGHIRCACLGDIIKLPLSKVSLFEDLGMTAMAAFMLIT